MLRPFFFLALAVLLAAPLPLRAAERAGFAVEAGPQPERHHPLAPEEGETVAVNPPSLVWRHDPRAKSYAVELSRDAKFSGGVLRADGIPYSFHNYKEALDAGRWYWRYFVVAGDGAISAPGPVRSFIVPEGAARLPLPPPAELLARMPGHPRVFVTPGTLADFRAQREGPAREAWESIRAQADGLLNLKPPATGRRVPLAEAKIVHSEVSISHTWKKGDPVRRQVFALDGEGAVYWVLEYSFRDLARDAGRADVLSAAYLISGDARYAEAARRWVSFVSDFRIDRHLTDAQRAEHDTVVYAYENGLKALALAYDRVYDQMTPDERRRAIAHVEYHADAAGRWIRDRSEIHLNYQQSHVQQCMHTLLTTVLAAAGDSPLIDGWVNYLVPQYVNRIAWTSADGGYFEGQTYGHKFGWILEGLAAIRSACGIDLFQRPEIRNAGTYWLYAMNLNYWFQHWGDNYSLIWPYANPRDSYISGFLAAMTRDPYVKWYADTVLTDPESIPFRYLSDGAVAARPPVDIPQARVFPDTGTVAAYDRFYDHRSDRVFFRSSPWGSHSHSHADQNAFVIHSGGEILAPDTGYYTYSGDKYHYQWSKSTFAHNSLLVNGRPQPLGIESKGRVSGFFHGGKMTWFQGDASRAYEAPLETFRRSMVFIRPGVYVVYDELKAGKPATFGWLLNTFDRPEIDAEARRMVVAQGGRRLQVEHLLPEALTYKTDNKRPYPIKTPGKMWSRYTEAFPQPWHTEASNRSPETEPAFLTFMSTRGAGEAAAERPVAVENPSTVGLVLGGGRGTVLFRRHADRTEPIQGGSVRADGQMAAVLGASWSSGEWMLAEGSRLDAGGRTLWRSERPVSASASFATPAAAALVRVQGRAGAVRLALPEKPGQLFAAEPNRPETARPLAFEWERDGTARFVWDGEGPVEIWAAPTVDLTAPIPAASLRVTDAGGAYEIPLRTAWSEQGEWVYFADCAMPREPGVYRFFGDASDLLVQDRWDMARSVSGTGEAEGSLRAGTGLYFRVAPGAGGAPVFRATLAESFSGRLDSVLFNGGFEAGTPGYPPRGWTFQKERGEGPGWPEWSQADAAEGRSALRLRGDAQPAVLLARPLRLLEGGEYLLRFRTKGDAAGASVRVRGARGGPLTVRATPGAEWSEQEARVTLAPGYTLLSIEMPGGTEGRTLWVDDVRLGRVAAEVEEGNR